MSYGNYSLDANRQLLRDLIAEHQEQPIVSNTDSIARRALEQQQVSPAPVESNLTKLREKFRELVRDHIEPPYYPPNTPSWKMPDRIASLEEHMERYVCMMPIFRAETETQQKSIRARNTLIVWAALILAIRPKANVTHLKIRSGDLIQKAAPFERWLEENKHFLSQLTKLDLSNNYLTELPDCFGKLTELTELNLSNNLLSSLPPSFKVLSNLELLTLDNNRFTDFPDEITDCMRLEHLSISGNKIGKVPVTIGYLGSLTYLNLSVNQISELPNSFTDLVELRVVELDTNQLSALPSGIGSLIELESLNLKHNQFRNLSEELRSLPNLKQLELTGNKFPKKPKI